ncbi:MAG: type II secretion system protein N [Phenylobacterium sp.]|uniref:type II secretion system protein N n=1 Tax=Phenylobacterium sp. TaxID=1871053 RepID=UPI00391C0141
MSRRALIALFALAFLVALAATAPLSVALAVSGAPARGLSAQTVSGGVWRGELRGAAFGGLPLGDLRVGLDPLSLVVGRASLWFEGETSAAPKGRLQATRSGLSLHKLNGAVPVERVLTGLPLEGRLVFQDARVAFSGGACREAGGRVALRGVPVGGLGVELEADGPLACVNQDLVAALTGPVVSVEVRIAGDGGYRARTTVQAADAAIRGFERTATGQVRTDEGRIGR